ncbi:MAG: hypothetical protein CXZ00_00940 [Acidobacteria bacterium]|nr:MAG: hypothetical protein CXZ00_00940 [Acidobacteriota bacterium]
MHNANVSKCANPECKQEFKQLGKGKVFVRPVPKNSAGLTQKTLWLCPACAKIYDLRYDRHKQEFTLVHLRRTA